jgi:hypothetical protein
MPEEPLFFDSVSIKRQPEFWIHQATESREVKEGYFSVGALWEPWIPA